MIYFCRHDSIPAVEYDETLNPDYLVSRVIGDIEAGGLILPGESVMVGVSGGLDSMVLLSVLNVILETGEKDFKIIAAHFDHGLRNDSSKDAEFVSSVARKMEIECIVGKGTLDSRVENAARNARYDFFIRASSECGASKVALAHHADDNCETVLFRMFRGTALRGLAGMPVERTLGDEPPVQLIRPLLNLRRDEILSWAKSRGLQWREDSTNLESEYSRNFLRNELLPLLREKLNPRVDEAILRLRSLAAETEDFLIEKGGELLADSILHSGKDQVIVDTAIFRAGHPEERKTAVRMIMQSLGLPERNLTADHITAVDSLVENGGSMDLPGGCRVLNAGDQLVITRAGG